MPVPLTQIASVTRGNIVMRSICISGDYIYTIETAGGTTYLYALSFSGSSFTQLASYGPISLSPASITAVEMIVVGSIAFIYAQGFFGSQTLRQLRAVQFNGSSFTLLASYTFGLGPPSVGLGMGCDGTYVYFSNLGTPQAWRFTGSSFEGPLASTSGSIISWQAGRLFTTNGTTLWALEFNGSSFIARGSVTVGSNINDCHWDQSTGEFYLLYTSPSYTIVKFNYNGSVFSSAISSVTVGSQVNMGPVLPWSRFDKTLTGHLIYPKGDNGADLFNNDISVFASTTDKIYKMLQHSLPLTLIAVANIVTGTSYSLRAYTYTASVLEADFSAAPLSGDASLLVQFTDLSTGNPTSWDWDFGDGSPHSNEQNPEHLYIKAGVYTVSLTVSNDSGSDTETKTSYITVNIVAEFSGTPLSDYVPLTVNFLDLSKGEPTTWLWDFGDGTSTEQNPAHTYTIPGGYTVSLTVSRGSFIDTETKTNYIIAKVKADFEFTPASGSTPLEVTFNDRSIGSPVSWFWDFGDSHTSDQQNPTHVYTSAGIYTVSLTVFDGFSTDTITKFNIIVVKSPSVCYDSSNCIDTCLVADRPNIPYGKDYTIELAHYEMSARKFAILKWSDPLPPYNPFSNVTDASIILDCFSTKIDLPQGPFNVHLLTLDSTKTWDENEATWQVYSDSTMWWERAGALGLNEIDQNPVATFRVEEPGKITIPLNYYGRTQIKHIIEDRSGLWNGFVINAVNYSETAKTQWGGSLKIKSGNHPDSTNRPRLTFIYG